MVKIRRNRMPKNWKNMTSVRSVSGILASNADNRPNKIEPELQLKKVEHNCQRLRKQIEKNKKLLYDSTTTPEKKAWVQGAIVKLEHKLAIGIMRQTSLKDTVRKNQEADNKRKETVRKDLEAAKARSDKFEKQNNKSVKPQKPGRLSGMEIGHGYKKQFIEVVAGKRRVRNKWVNKDK